MFVFHMHHAQATFKVIMCAFLCKLNKCIKLDFKSGAHRNGNILPGPLWSVILHVYCICNSQVYSQGFISSRPETRSHQQEFK